MKFQFQISYACCLCIWAEAFFIFSDVTYKIATWQPYWIFRFPDCMLALNIKSKLHWHITCVYGKKPIDFQQYHFENGCLAAILDFSLSGLCRWHGLRSIIRVCFGIALSNFICMSFVAMGQSLMIFIDVSFQMAALDFSLPWLLTLVWLWIYSANFSSKSFLYMDGSLLIFSNVTFKMTVWWPYWIFQFLDSNFSLGYNSKFALEFHFQISYACCLWLWAKAYWFLQMSLSK